MAATSRVTFDPESLLRSLMTNVPGTVYRCHVDAAWTMLGIGDDIERITDDGCGGADQRRGSGLRGLTDRLGALRGMLELESPPGRGTSLRARVPLH